MANRTGDAVGELARVHHNKGGGSIAAPSDILDNTTGANGHTGYNEIVLVGRSPEGAVVSVSGIFIKVHPNGNYYVDPRKKTPHVTPELEKLIKGCSATKGIPVAKIVDKSSADSAFAIPF